MIHEVESQDNRVEPQAQIAELQVQKVDPLFPELET